MRPVVIELVALGPARRPSVMNWIQQSTGHVYVGPKNKALAGSGFAQEEQEMLETRVTKYIHFQNKGDMDEKIANFAWMDGTDYFLGYHVNMVTSTLVDAFKSRLEFFFAQAGLNVTIHIGMRHNLNTMYLAEYTGEQDKHINCFAMMAMKKTQQHIFIGKNTMWQAMADTVSIQYDEMLDAMQHRSGYILSKNELCPYLELFICRDSARRAEWQSRYVQELTDKRVACDIFQDGACFVIDVTHRLRGWEIVSPQGLIKSLRPDLLTANALDEVPLNDIFSGTRTKNTYELNPGLMRLEAILSYVRVHVELRQSGSIGADPEKERTMTAEDVEDEYTGGCRLNLVCFTHGIVPVVSTTQLKGLMDTSRRAYIISDLTFKRKLHPCCISVMLSQVQMYKHPINDKIVVVNPTQPLAFHDQRKVAFISDEPLTTALWPSHNIIWETYAGLDCKYEHRHIKRYVANHMNQCQWTMEDYQFINHNPGGVLDHMLRYHVGTEKRVIGTSAQFKRSERPVGDLIAAAKKARSVSDN